MIAARVTINDSLSPAIAEAIAQSSPERCARVAARFAAAVFTAHFEKLSGERHRPAMAHDFYLQAARASAGRADGAAAVVEVNAPTGLRQRLLGGDIKPTKSYKLRRGKKEVAYSALWIPVGAAVGRTGGDFRGQLRVVWNEGTQKGVAIDKATKAVLFALVGSVSQAPDPTVIPSEQDLRDGIIPGVVAAIRRAAAGRETEG